MSPDVDVVMLVASVPAIVALVNLLKDSGLPAKLSPLIAVMLGVGLNLAVWRWGGQEWFTFAAQGLLFGLAASGVYDLFAPAKVVAKRAEVEGGGVNVSTYPTS